MDKKYVWLLRDPNKDGKIARLVVKSKASIYAIFPTKKDAMLYISMNEDKQYDKILKKLLIKVDAHSYKRADRVVE